MMTDKQIHEQELGIPPEEIAVGHLFYEFMIDPDFTSNLVFFRIYNHGGQQLFGGKMTLHDWEKFAALTHSFHIKIKDIACQKLM